MMTRLLLVFPNQVPTRTDSFNYVAPEDDCASVKVGIHNFKIYNVSLKSEALKVYKRAKEINPDVIGILLITKNAAADAEVVFLTENLSLMPSTILPSWVIKTINIIKKGYLSVPRFMLQTLRDELLLGKVVDNKESITWENHLTPREDEINELISRGYSNKEIADRLFISVSTVKSHIYKIFRKTSIKNRTQAIIMKQ
jgi:DNA-binding NarL/FixJ family response regulator